MRLGEGEELTSIAFANVKWDIRERSPVDGEASSVCVQEGGRV